MTNILRPARFGGPVTRYIHTLDGDGSYPYYSLGSAWDGGSASWYVTAEIATTYAAAAQDIFSAGTFALVVRLRSDGKLEAWVNFTQITSSAPTVDLLDGKLHKIKVSWDSGTTYVSFDIDDGTWSETVNTAVTYTTQQINYIGARDASNNPLIGQILSVDINGEHGYSFDSNSTSTVADTIGSNDLTMNNFTSSDIVEYTWETDAAGGGEAGWLGPENVFDPGFDNASLWYQTDGTFDVTGGTLVADGDEGIGDAIFPSSDGSYGNRLLLTPGVYLYAATVSSYTSGSLKWRAVSNPVVEFSAAGYHAELDTLTIAGVNSRIVVGSTGAQSISDCSVKSFIEVE